MAVLWVIVIAALIGRGIYATLNTRQSPTGQGRA